MFKLDLIIATYNRPELLATALHSISEARFPDDMQLTIVVADNNSAPDKQRRNQEAMARYPQLPLVYRVTTTQGKSHALNDAIAATGAEYVGFIDDDEKVDPAWFEVAAQYVRAGVVDYFGGPYKPDWQQAAPDWLPIHAGKYKAVLGWIEQSPVAAPFETFSGGMCGGNCVIRRTALLAAGCFATNIGRIGNNLMCGEDDELHRKLTALGKKGMYDPALIIYHFIPVSRMTRRYHLRWAFWSGASNGVRLGWLPPEPVPMLFGLPRYRFGLAASGAVNYLRSAFARTPAARGAGFASLMDVWYFAGTLYGQRVLQARHRRAEATA